MDTLKLRIILPNDQLARQVEQRLAPHARTERERASTLDFGTIVMMITLAGATVAVYKKFAETEKVQAETEKTQAETEKIRAETEQVRLATLNEMLALQQQLQQQGQAEEARIGAPGSELRTFADADEAFLRGLLGLNTALH
jgi:cytochrome c oxidase assembly protein Cox11